MAVSVRMDPLLEKQLEQAAKRQGVTKSQFIIDAVERALGGKNPYELLLKVQEEMAPYRVQFEATPEQSQVASADPEAPLGTGERVRQILEAKHQASLSEWQDYQAEKLAKVKRDARP